MKLAKRLFLSSLLVFALPLFSQTASQPTPESDSIASARCRYAPADTECHQRETGRATVLAQFPRGRGFRPPMRPRAMGYPGGYPSMYAGEPNGRHALIGALIGFGLGAALGAKANSDQHLGAGVKAAFLVGGLGALVGAAVGAGTPSFQSHYHHRRSSWPNPDEDASAGHSRKEDVRLASASAPASSENAP